MCDFTRKAEALCERVDLDAQANNHPLRDGFLEGISKYLLIKKLYAIYNDDNCNGNEKNVIFNSFFDIFGDFYDLNEVLRSGKFDKEKLQDLLKTEQEDNQGDYALRLGEYLDKLAKPPEKNKNKKKNNQIVFASKALHTFNNFFPIVDSFIGNFFGLNYYKTGEYSKKRENAIKEYKKLVGFYKDKEKNGLKSLKEKFDKIINDDNVAIIRNGAEDILNKYRDISSEKRREVLAYVNHDTINAIADIKKIDFVIWSYWKTTIEIVDEVPEGNDNVYVNTNYLESTTDKDREDNRKGIRTSLRNHQGFNNIIYMNMIPDHYLPPIFEKRDDKRVQCNNVHKKLIKRDIKSIKNNGLFYKIYLVRPRKD